MRVLHLNAVSSGGAFVAARRIHEGLINEGINSQFMVLDNLNNDSSIKSYLHSRPFSRKLIESIKYRLYKYELREVGSDKYLIAHLPYSAFDITSNHLIKEVDIVHLHWVPEMIDLRYFFKKIGKPVVWTHHDDWVNNEIYHYEDDLAEQNPRGKYFNIKKKSLLTSNVKSVVPSTWLMKRIKCYHPLTDVVMIANGITLTNKKKEFHKNEKLKVLLVSEDVDDQRKGIRSFLAMVTNKMTDIEFIVVGKTKLKIDIDNIHLLGYINSKSKYEEVICQSDLFVIPSINDNLPNVLLETMDKDVPGIGFRTGGIPDLIINGKTGYTTDVGDFDSIFDIIEKLNRDRSLLRKLGEGAKSHISENFDIKKQTRKYIALYESIS